MTVANRRRPFGRSVGFLLAAAVVVPLVAAGVASLIYARYAAPRLAIAVAAIAAASGAAVAIGLAGAALRRSEGQLVATNQALTAAGLAASAAEDAAARARDEALTAQRAREEFLASITHALRSPLNACLMWIDVLALSPMADNAKQAVATVRRNLELQARLLDDLGDFARLSAGGIPLYTERTNLEKLLDDRLERWRTAGRTAGVELAYACSPGSYALELDSERILQVLDSLLAYAFEATPAGGRVALRLGNDGELVVVEIDDGGNALDEDELEGLFKPLTGKDRERRNLALRLTIAKHLVEQHEGSLTAWRSGANRGCSFRVRLPRSAAGAASETRREVSSLE